ncbi:unnamed protein product [Cylindrotheca closterium]|uniref:Uncharacterized protein n=1 Tax=Cylindrotheca closterium TaxID=2856 RepID=A0AAD2GDT1_9STRA|nr:unnamed protein product [Cylindrotheca closterium]
MQIPCRQLCRAPQRRLKETRGIPLIGTTTTSSSSSSSSSSSENGTNDNEDNNNFKTIQAKPQESYESAYTPPSFLQEEVSKLEQMLEQRENWMKLSERSRGGRGGATPASNITLAASIMFDTDDEDDYNSVGSNQSLKEELEWAEMELGRLSINTRERQIRCEASAEGEANPQDGFHHSMSIIFDDDTASTTSANMPNLKSSPDAIARDCASFHAANDRETHASKLPDAAKEQEDDCDSSFIRRIHRTESILFVSSAIFVASLLLGAAPSKKTQSMRFKPFHAY